VWRSGAVMAQYQNRISELEAWKAHMTTKYKRLEDRRAMDLEGFNRDVTALRKALGLTERKLHQMRLVLRLDVRPVPADPQLPLSSQSVRSTRRRMLSVAHLHPCAGRGYV
jgi:hypothetical protein